jgi:cobalamin biosynthesis Mg chelatase CobN
MFNKYLVLLVGLVAAIYVPKTNAHGLCSCSCCDYTDCDPIYQGVVDVPSCDEFSCINACKATYPFACDSTTTSEVAVTCQEESTTSVIVTTSTSPQTSQSTSVTVTTSTSPQTSQSTSVTVTTSTSPQTSQSTSVTITTSTSPQTTQSTLSTSTVPKSTTQHDSGAFIVRESPSFIALLVTSLFIINNLYFKTIN